MGLKGKEQTTLHARGENELGIETERAKGEMKGGCGRWVSKEGLMELRANK